MASSRFTIFLIFNILFLFSISVKQSNAIRFLGTEQRLRTQSSLLASLPRGPVPKSGGSPCTYIPGQGSGSCKLNEKHFFGGGSARVPPASPRAGIASVVAKDKVVKDFAS
ncbi:hypothetical protein BUALT_Bualt14G0108100 [Buddleja alternifolia]|uniref:Uncharacterized protein n=1 Tax=Buddleja alternifolia TaxID=168488 RepID=A0AAV6WJK8_9LAMI|nr:hypothetical protein BUALT_Bualt14G0108100 [Buddleja alternifolia]